MYRFSHVKLWHYALLGLALFLFIYLGVWQLFRADEKKQLMRAASIFSHQDPVLFNAKKERPEHYQRLRIKGHFLPFFILLDNQHDEHRFGYHVINPFMLKNQQVVLVDRGWIPGDPSRQSFPPIDLPSSTLTLVGQAYYPSKKTFILGEIMEKKRNDTVLIESIDIALLSEFLHKSVYPFIIRLDGAEPYGFKRNWLIVSMPPYRHYAYALQWFAMAAVSIIIFIGLTLKKSDDSAKT